METRLAQLQPLIQELFDLSCSPGMSLGVLHQGSPVFTAHFGRRRVSELTLPDDDTLYNVASLTKLMTAGVVSNLVAEGLLDWDVPIRKYLPEFGERKDEVGQKATITDLLANRTGLSAQNTFWGVMKEDILLDPDQIPQKACYIPAIGKFRKSFIYSSWGYGLVTSVIECVTEKPFSVCVEKYIFQPLGMYHSTTNIPQVDNVVFKHWVGTDGVAHEFPWSAQRGRSDETGFGGAVAARSSTRELLVMYQSLLHAYHHQITNNIDSTPRSPFKYARRIMSPHIGIGNASAENQGYCLGAYRTKLPGNLSAVSYNSLLLQKKDNRTFGESHAGRPIFHQVASFTGYNGSMFLDPQSQTAIFVLVNSLPLFDVTDLVGQLLLGSILGEASSPDFVGLAKSVKSRNMILYDSYTAALAKKKTNIIPQFPLQDYEGEYLNQDKIICYCVSVNRKNQLRISVKGRPRTNFLIHHWGGELFCVPPNRELEVSQSMWPFMPLKSRMFVFNCGKDGIESFTWHHDVTPGSKPETFVKDTHRSIAKL
jgi:CubicO group peptidase (beta-lactamase class C family)